MGGFAFIAPYGSIEADMQDGSRHTTFTKPAIWTAPHAYLTQQLNDRVWLGLAAFSRFGLGNSFSGNWDGRYSVYDVGVQTFSFVPTLAVKLNDVFSVSAGVEAMYAHMYMGNKIPTVTPTLEKYDNDMQLEGTGWGMGAQFGLHMRLSDQWSVGLSYKSQVTMRLDGDVEFGRHDQNMLVKMGQHLPAARDCSANTTLQLPDSAALGIAYKPLDNLSFEVGAVWTRWSTYNALNIYMDNGYSSVNNKGMAGRLELQRQRGIPPPGLVDPAGRFCLRNAGAQRRPRRLHHARQRPSDAQPGHGLCLEQLDPGSGLRPLLDQQYGLRPHRCKRHSQPAFRHQRGAIQKCCGQCLYGFTGVCLLEHLTLEMLAYGRQKPAFSHFVARIFKKIACRANSSFHSLTALAQRTVAKISSQRLRHARSGAYPRTRIARNLRGWRLLTQPLGRAFTCAAERTPGRRCAGPHHEL